MTTEQINIRREAEGNVRSYHIGILPSRNRKDSQLDDSQLRMEWIRSIRGMDNIILLRYVHPEDRSSIAIKMMKADMISRFEAKEFAKILG